MNLHEAFQAISLLTYALLAAMVLAGYFGWLLNQCRCPSCEFHKHERRVAAAKIKSEAETAARQQRDRQHDYQHKGGSWVNGDPDKFNCDDPSCRRNPRRVE